MQVGTPPGTRYTFEGAIATALGPRDDAWLESAIADPRVAIEVTPWWSDATDRRYLLNRALALMWLAGALAQAGDRRRGRAARGRPSTAVEGLSDRTRPALSMARLGGAHLLHGLRGRDDAPGQLRTKLEPAEAPIGYRRDPVSISHEGWALEIPGEFAERRTEEEWWGGGAGRSVTLAATDTGSMAAHAFLAQVAGDLGGEALSHQAGRGRGPCPNQQRRVVRRGGRRARRLLGDQRLGRRDPHRLRRPGRLAVGARSVAVARPGLIAGVARLNATAQAPKSAGAPRGRIVTGRLVMAGRTSQDTRIRPRNLRNRLLVSILPRNSEASAISVCG